MTEMMLQTRELSKRYGSFTAVDRLSLDIRRGEVFGLLGPNGAGKTTFISMVCGLLRCDGGEVLLHDRPLHGLDRAARSIIGICPQSTIIWEKLTCLEQLVFAGQMYDVPTQVARRRGMQLLEGLGLAEKAGKLAGTLSGGMKRRLNLALALVHDPEFVILDEPEAGLDPQSRVLVREYISALAQEKTILLTTHNMDEADRMSDRVAIIDHGRLLELDTPAALKQRLGQGDVIEIKLANGKLDAVQAKQVLASMKSEVRLEEHSRTLYVRALNAVGQLAAILERLSAAGFQAGEIIVHTNTLENVFIQLTGRRLRD